MVVGRKGQCKSIIGAKFGSGFFLSRFDSLITGQLGVNPELVELENNFPRFNLLNGENESNEDILKRVIEKGR